MRFFVCLYVYVGSCVFGMRECVSVYLCVCARMCFSMHVCVCACVRACVRVFARA